MKNSRAKHSVNFKSLVLICLLVVLAMVFTLVACSHKDTNPNNFPPVEDATIDDGNDGESGGDDAGNTQTPDDNQTPDTPQTPDDTQEKAIAEFLASLNLENKNATMTITVSFGGRMLAQKTTEYVRSANGGTMTVTTTTMNAASSKEPYKTESLAPTTLTDAEFESKFPYADALDVDLIKTLDYTLSTTANGTSLSFAITPTTLKSFVSLTDDEANNIASNVSVVIASEGKLTATYKSANGNDVEIKIIYR